MKAKAKTNGNYTKASFTEEISAGEPQEKSDQGPDFLGKTRDSIIAGVAVDFSVGRTLRGDAI